MRNLLTALLIIGAATTQAQIGIGTSTPAASAQLDISSFNKGFLPPRIALTATTDGVSITAPATGLLIYNTATAGVSPNQVTPGYYFYSGTKWKPLISELPANQVLFDASVLGYVPLGRAAVAPADTVIGSSRFIKRHQVVNPANGHSYALYSGRNTGNSANLSLNWFNTFNFGKAINGYLLTMTSTDEIDFVRNNFLSNAALSLDGTNSVSFYSSSNIWLGFAKIVEPGNPVRLGWITGERSRVNWSLDPAVTDANFKSGEPNNNGGTEGFVHVYATANTALRQWNDLAGTSITTGTNQDFNHIIIEFNQ